MTTQELSKLYCDATIRIHKIADEVYEDIHTLGGEAITDSEYVGNKLNIAIKAIRSECDFIRSAIKEWEETNGL
jgi:hypothetical protein